MVGSREPTSTRPCPTPSGCDSKRQPSVHPRRPARHPRDVKTGLTLYSWGGSVLCARPFRGWRQVVSRVAYWVLPRDVLQSSRGWYIGTGKQRKQAGAMKFSPEMGTWGEDPAASATDRLTERLSQENLGTTVRRRERESAHGPEALVVQVREQIWKATLLLTVLMAIVLSTGTGVRAL